MQLSDMKKEALISYFISNGQSFGGAIEFCDTDFGKRVIDNINLKSSHDWRSASQQALFDTLPGEHLIYHLHNADYKALLLKESLRDGSVTAVRAAGWHGTERVRPFGLHTICQYKIQTKSIDFYKQEARLSIESWRNDKNKEAEKLLERIQ